MLRLNVAVEGMRAHALSWLCQSSALPEEMEFVSLALSTMWTGAVGLKSKMRGMRRPCVAKLNEAKDIGWVFIAQIEIDTWESSAKLSDCYYYYYYYHYYQYYCYYHYYYYRGGVFKNLKFKNLQVPLGPPPRHRPLGISDAVKSLIN